MRTWEEVKTCMADDIFMSIQNREDSAVYQEYVNELIHYVKIGLSHANMKYLTHRFNDNHVTVLFENKSKLYICEFNRWGLRCTIYLCMDRQKEFDNINNDYLWFYTKHTRNDFNKLSAEDLFSNMKFPKHAKFNIGDIVRLNENGIRKYCYYSEGDKDKILKITGINYNSNRIDYSFEALAPKNNGIRYQSYYNSYAECNLVKIKNGI